MRINRYWVKKILFCLKYGNSNGFYVRNITTNYITLVCSHTKLCQNVKKYPFSYQNPAMLLEKPKYLPIRYVRRT